MGDQYRTFTISARAPFRLDLTVWALRRRPDNAVDGWDGRTYRRVLVLDSGPVELTAIQFGRSELPQLKVELTGAGIDESAAQAAQSILIGTLGLERDLSPFYRLAESDPLLRTLAARFRGLKPPRFPSLFECLANAIACQQVTLTVGILLLNRLVEARGARFGQNRRAFPRPTDLVSVSPEALRPLGFSRAKARSIVELARAVAAGELVVDELEMLDDAAALARLLRLRGIGRWSGEYALLRGLGRLNVFPGDDVGARNNLARHLSRSGPLDYAAVEEAVRPWQPYAGLVYLHLLLADLCDRGLLTAPGA